MEIYVMKKKFVLTLALVLIVAATVVAAPVELSGEFKAGYTFGFDPLSISNEKLDGSYADAAEISVTGDFWSVTFDALAFTGDSDNAATAKIFLDKALAEQGMDMGDLTVTLGVGSKGSLKPADVYTDSNDAVSELKMLATGNSFDVTIGYGSMVSAYVGADPTDTTNKPFVLGVTTTPVDGVKAGFGYTNYAEVVAAVVADPLAAPPVAGVALVTSAGITGSVTVDVAALAGLDFGLSLSAIDIYHLERSDNATAVNNLYTELNASYEDVAAWVEYQLLDGTSNLIAKASYSGIENVDVYGKLTLEDLSSITTTIGAGASYTMGGVKYALDASYVVEGAFSITPSVYIAF
jgi:hypothetical protein